MRKKEIPEERIVELKNQIELFSTKSKERNDLLKNFANLYSVSINTVYRRLRERLKPKSIKRIDKGVPRKISSEEMEKYCQVIAAMKLRTRNKKNHHLSTAESIRILEEFGIETPDGVIKIPKSYLKISTINRYLYKYGYDKQSLCVQPPVIRFQAKYSNDCWHFDLSPSDFKDVKDWPAWVDPQKGRPVLMLYGIVDDRSGVSYQEYHVVYGEDVEAALKFMFNAMSLKEIDGFPFQGIPKMIYSDNGPIIKSRVFKRVMDYLGIEIRSHLPRDKDGRRITARSKGKIERPFRTLKEVHETLYHFHKPKNQDEANEWLLNYILRYNEKPHRSEPHSRIEDWLENLSAEGIRKMCSWDRFCTFARESERRKVRSEAKVSVNGILYDVDPELVGRDVILWFGIFDNQLYVELGDKKYGPYKPSSGPIPLKRFRSFKKTMAEKRADDIEELSKIIHLPITTLTTDSRSKRELLRKLPDNSLIIEFDDPDPFNEIYFSNIISAKKYVSSILGIPLAKLSDNEIAIVNDILDRTLEKKKIEELIRDHFSFKKYYL